MIASEYIVNSITHAYMVFVTEESLDSFFWFFFLALLIIAAIIVSAIIYYFSQKPDEWEHIPLFDEEFQGGRLKYFSDTIKNSNYNFSDSSMIKNHIKMLFFEKIRSIHGISTYDLNQMKEKDPQKLKNLINDKEISNWIIQSKKIEKKEKFFDRFKEDKNLKKQEFFNDMNKILDKMELWGK
jgi:esterase/lipase superfamily enzyme